MPTPTAALHDQPEKIRGARAAALSIVPYSSGAAKALGKVIPELDGRLTGYSLRVPVPVVSIVDLTVTLERDVTEEEVNNAFRNAAATGPLKGSWAIAMNRSFQATTVVTRVHPLSTACQRW